MSDPAESSENIFKKQSTKGSFSIYEVNKTNFEETFRPQDVISCVNTQLKAYQVADSIKTKNKQISKKFLTCKRSFLNVTKLPIYVQTPKQDIKFDTQGVTDSQLRNIIETAEILEAHRGMTQEFETDFVQNNTECEPHNLISEKDSATNITNDDFDAYNDGINNLVMNNIENNGINNRIDAKTINNLNSGSNLGNENSINKKIQGINKDISLNSIETTEDTNIEASQILTSKTVKRKKTNIVSDYEQIKYDVNRNDNLIHSVINDDLSDIITEGYCINGDIYGVTSKYNDNNGKDNDKDNNISIVISNNKFPGSQILNTKVSRKRENSGEEFHKADTQIAISTQMLNQFVETQSDETDRPTSPIFPTNVLKQPLNVSPLIFNLDKFEQFESIANPIIETLDFETAKHVINSQILNKELHIQINDVNLQKKEVLNTTVNKFTIESVNTKPIERDKTNAKDILNQGGDTTSEESTRNKLSTDNLRDEILFSSDEECTNTHEQDLFTCALETSFYDQADVLDKTVYVGFQTASNKSIQVLADSFAKAKSLLNDVISDDITVTDLVNNTNHNTSIEKSKMDGIEEAKPDLLVNEVNNSSDKDRTIKDIVTNSHLLTSNKEMNQDPKLSEADADKFVGFKTANNKNIILSENSLVRYKKVFQDIDLNEDFNSTDTALLNNVDVSEIKKKNEPCKNNKSENCNTTSDILQGIDDKILQEFENIEMSLEDNKNENIKNVSEIYNVDEFNHLTDKGSNKDGGQHELINTETEFNPFVNKTKSKMNISEIKLHGFKTASNKNINISKNAWAKSKSVFENIDEISNTTFKHKDETLKLATTAGEAVDTSLPLTSTDFIGFRTANNNVIKISEKAMLHTKKVFNDIDSTKLINKTTKDYPKTSSVEENKNVNYVNKTKDFIDNQYIVPKAINNKHIETSKYKEIMSNTYLDYNGLKYPQHIENEHEIVCRTTKQTDVVNKSIVDNIEFTYDEMAANKPISPEFNGFKTASNKIIKVSQEILIKTRNIFKDIDSIDFKDLNRNKKEYPDLGTNVTCNERRNNVERDKKIPDTKCQNSMTHNNKCNKISPKAIIEPKQALQSIENRLENKINDQNPSHNEFENCNNKWKVRARSPVFKGFQSGNNKAVTVPDKTLNKSKELFKDFDKEISINMPISGFVGFQTASNKKVTISEKALENSKIIFKDIDDINTDRNSLKSKSLYPKKNYQNDDIDNIELLINKNKSQNTKHHNFDCQNKISDANQFGNINDNSENRSTSPVFKGFQTGNNKAVTVSDKALKKIKELFGDVDQEISINMPITGFVGFQTASNKKVTISEKALENSKKIFKDIDDINTDVNNLKLKPLYPKEIYQNDDIDNIEVLINKNKPQNARHHNFDCENNISDANKFGNSNDNSENRFTSQVFKSFQTGKNKAVMVSDKALKKSKELFKDLDKEICTNNPITGFVGFQTASNKKVTISEKALENSKKIFKDIDDINTDGNILKSKPLYPKEIYQNEDIDNIEILINNNTSQNAKRPNFEWQNKISDANEIVNSNDNLENRSTSPVFRGFQTGNNKAVAVSDSALKKSKELFKDLDEKISVIMPITGFVGFQTASSKKVTISEKALENSKKIFKDIDDINSDCNNLKSKPLYPKEIYQNDDTETLIDKNTEIEPTFKGFHTASSRPVSISKNALEKSKKLLQDLENTNRGKADYIKFQTGNNNLEVSKRTVTENKIKINLDILKNNTFKGFQTGNNKTIIVTDEALAKSKRLFSEIDDQIIEHLNKKDKKEISNIDDTNILIDTQIINNFEQSLNTEDFRYDSPKRSKRSGSPILSCPRVKKRKKFETPYNLNTIKPIIKSKPIIKQPKILYRHDYKKDKKYCLKNIKDITKDIDSKIDSYILQFKYENLLDFQFNKERNELSDEVITIDLLKDDFINSVNSKLVPDGWVDNHLKLILWKLISYEIKFKIMFCTVKNVMEQLKYRYDRELYNAERPALRKILEKDDVPGKTLVLCVVEIFSDGVTTSSVTKTSNVELLLTDGWYFIQCTIDKMLMELVCNKKIIVGTKLVTCGAELLGCDQGVSPWEDTSAVRLKIFGNSTRRARWDAKLGYHGNDTILSQLSSVKVLGGKVSKLRVFVTRVYPALYVEKFDDGSTVTRSERLENLHHMKMESDRQITMEKICEEVEKEFIDQESEDSEGMFDTSCKRTCMETGSQIAKMMKSSKDPLEFTAQLSHTQTRLLEDHTSKNRDRLIQEMQVRVREKIDKAGVCVNRNVVCLLKIRIAGLRLSEDKVEITKGMMSIWKPTDSVCDIIKESAWLDIMNVVPTALRLGEIQISAGRQSIFSTSKFKPIEKFKPYTNLLQRKCYTIKDLAQNPAISTDYNEIDTIGLIFLIDPAIDLFDPAKQSFQNIYLSDADCNIICVHFWGGIKKFGFQNILDTGQIVFCGNIQKRAGNTRKNIPQFRVTELSYFTQTPRNEDAKQILEELNKKMLTLNRKEHCEKCILLKNNYSVFKQNYENVSPCRGINNSDINLSKNKIFIDSPLVRAKQEIFNFSGIDFECTFRQDTQLSVEVLKRKRKVNEKIAKLEMYGEPPPLTNLNIINTSKKASSSYKSPLVSDNIKKSHLTPNNIHNTPKSIQNSNSSLKNDSDVCENVASVKRSPRNCGIDRSIAMNRTYVKGLNPVKINFDVPNDNIDPFAEEFDVSPPLSLDDYSL